jgi:hypothetical protein
MLTERVSSLGDPGVALKNRRRIMVTNGTKLVSPFLTHKCVGLTVWRCHRGDVATKYDAATQNGSASEGFAFSQLDAASLDEATALVEFALYFVTVN